MIYISKGWPGSQGIRLLSFDSSERCNFQYAVLEVDEAEAGLSRDELLKVLHAERVLARRYFWPGCHRMEPYRSHFPHARFAPSQYGEGGPPGACPAHRNSRWSR